MYDMKVLDCSVDLEAGDHLAVAPAVEVPPLAGRLARVVDRAAAREHEAERAGLGARRHAGEHHAHAPVAPHVGDDRLVEAPERVVPRELAARPRERRVALLRVLVRLVARHVVHRPRLVDRHGAVFGARVASVLGSSLKSCDAEHYRVSQDRRRRGKLTAGGITGRIALFDSCGIMEMNSAQNTKRTRFEYLCPPRVRTIKMAPRVGFEPTTLRLTAGCSAVELPRNSVRSS